MEKPIEEVRSDIPFLDTGIIYLDNAATTPTPEPVINAMLEYFHEYSANIGRGLHRAAKRATEEFESSREKIAKTIGAKPNEIAYTKNTTEGLNLLSKGLGLKRGDKVITTVLEHHSNLIPWQRLEEKEGVNLEVIQDTSNFVTNPSAIEEAADENTSLITMSSVSNAFGTKQPIMEAAEIARDNDALFLIDAAQGVGHMPIDVKEIGCDFLVAPGHKGLLGPQGTGFVYIREDHLNEVEPLLFGGGIVRSVGEHEHKLVNPPNIFDAGTPNIPGIIGLGEGANYVLDIGLEKIEKRETKLVERMLKIQEIEGVEVYGPNSAEDLGGVVTFNVDGINHHEISSLLDELKKIATRSGNHCAQPAMNHFGLDGNVRASVHYYNKEENIDKFVETLEDIVKELAKE